MPANQADKRDSTAEPAGKVSWQLIAAATLLIIWMLFLVWMAIG